MAAEAKMVSKAKYFMLSRIELAELGVGQEEL